MKTVNLWPHFIKLIPPHKMSHTELLVINLFL